MLTFQVFRDGEPYEKFPLEGAYLIGQDSVPLRAEITQEGGLIRCQKRSQEAAGLALLWPAPPTGRMLLETTRLPDRREPYNLHLELARARIGQVTQKREDWGLFEYPGTDQFTEQLDEALGHLIEALKLQESPGQAARAADKALATAIRVSEDLALFHAEIFLTRRRSNGSLKMSKLGCGLNLADQSKPYCQRLIEAFDVFRVPLNWKLIEPREQEFKWDLLDQWVKWLSLHNFSICMGPLVSFAPHLVPDWLYLWEHDFDNVRDLIREHVSKVVKRYAGKVGTWSVSSGLHVYNTFNFNFEQLMELTRMAGAMTKKLAPDAKALIELVMPWGEYYARNPRSIPPLLYADMAVQSGIQFDGFAVQLFFGLAQDGYFVRDIMSISTLLDQFAGFGKPVHITAVEVPSNVAPDPGDFWGGSKTADQGGYWRRPWNDQTQAEWLDAFYRVALSKPFIESIHWQDLADAEGHYLPHGGLMSAKMEPKSGYEKLVDLRREMGFNVPAHASHPKNANKRSHNRNQRQRKPSR